MTRLLVLAVLLALGAPAVASADLRVLSVSSPPQTRQPGATFVVTGRVENTSARAKAPLLSFRLRSASGSRTYALTQSRLDPLARGRVRSYRARLRVPVRPVGGRYTLQACVKRSRLERARCRSARRSLRIVFPPRTAPLPALAPGAATPVAPAAAPARASTYAVGARTLGDRLFPGIGNGGYDAQHYALDLTYEPSTSVLSGTSTLTALATQDLAGFSLDLTAWNVVSAVTVDGVPAAFAQADEKLDVRPAAGIDAGSTFTVAVTYAGTQQPYEDPDGSREGWIPNALTGAVVVAEPVGAMGWFPNNNVPADKATVEVAMSVPSAQPWEVVGPGDKVAETAAGSRTRFVWSERTPTSTYLVGLGIGRYDVTEETVGGIDFTYAVDTTLVQKAAILAKLRLVPAIQDFMADFFDVPYPLSTGGGIVPFEDVDYALETQSKPLYPTVDSPASTGPSRGTIAHETAHQWLGNHATVARWDDIWLNEGPTDLMQWLWTEREDGGATAQSRYDAVWAAADGPQWDLPPAAIPDATEMFDPRIYARGAATMFGVLKILGEPAFRAMLHEHLTAPGHAFGTVSTASLIAAAKARLPTARAKDCLDTYFDQWLLQPQKPTLTYANFAACAA